VLVEYAPDIVIRPHFHRTDYCSMVVRGEVTVSGRVHRPGSIRRVAAGTTYGPLLAGPEGVLMVDVFEDRRGAAAVWRGSTDAGSEQLERATHVRARGRWDRTAAGHEVGRRETAELVS
jgi:hypothetical protein